MKPTIYLKVIPEGYDANAEWQGKEFPFQVVRMIGIVEYTFFDRSKPPGKKITIRVGDKLSFLGADSLCGCAATATVSHYADVIVDL